MIAQYNYAQTTTVVLVELLNNIVAANIMVGDHMDWNSLSQQSGGGGSAAAVSGGIESALTTLQPIRDLAKNWDIDIAAW